jgi:hypothetical protein
MRHERSAVLIGLLVVVLSVTGCTERRAASPKDDACWREEFGLSRRSLTPTGRNNYCVLEPGFQLILEKGKEGEKGHEKLAITVLDETKKVDGVATRVVEEKEWRNGKLVEVSRNYLAICKKSGDVFYFGEEVDNYRDGKMVGHAGAWLAGLNGAKAGLIMPAKPKVGMKYYQEMAPKVAMDRAEVVALDATLKTPAGSFTKCLKTKEGTPLDPREEEFKHYAPGIGLVQDEDLLLTQRGFAKDREPAVPDRARE